MPSLGDLTLIAQTMADVNGDGPAWGQSANLDATVTPEPLPIKPSSSKLTF